MIALLVAVVAGFYYIPWLYKLISTWIYQYPMVTKLPGPKGYPLIGSALDLAGGTHAATKFWVEEANKAREAGESIFTMMVLGRVIHFPLNGEAMKDIIESKTEIGKGKDYEFLRAWVGDGLMLSIGKAWRDRRKIIVPMFHYTMLEGYVNTFNKHARIMVDCTKKFVGKEADMGLIAKRCSLDIICDTAIGSDFGVQLNPTHPYMEAVDTFTRYAGRHNVEPQMWFTIIWYMFYHREYTKALYELNKLTEEVINKRVEAVKSGEVDLMAEQKPIIDHFLVHQAESKMSHRDMHYETNAVIFGGHDTTSSALTWVFWSLATQPHFQQQVYEEINEIFGDSDRDCCIDDMKRMVFTDRFIKESMRIFAPVPCVERELENDFRIGKYLLPKGSEVFISPFVIHHNKEVYPDPWKFDPDRFLPENSEGRHPHDYLPFGAGPRICLGQKFAMYEMKVIVSWAIRNFSFSTHHSLLDNVCTTEVVLKPALGCNLKVTLRN